MHFVIEHSYLIPLLPLVGAVVSGFFGARWLRGQSHWPIWIGVGLSAVLSFVLLGGMLGSEGRVTPRDAAHPYVRLAETAEFQKAASVDWYHWITVGKFDATAGFFLDPLTCVMLCVVTGVGLLICVFAAGYMKGERGYFRFFAYLGLFIFSMTVLVMGNNFVMLYLGWEGVGLCSYLLIGFYYERPAAREAAKKAFLVNRIGDFGFGIGIMLIFLVFGTVSFFGSSTQAGVLIRATQVSWADPGLMHYWIPFLLMLGAFGKSAQFPLYVWLPDAMEGPTPVSALIHAATMVTAGVYMIVRCSTLFVFNEAAMLTIACIGAFTAILAASIALRQFDLKRVFAYSTISQLGFMFAGAGVLAPVASIFHLVTHAFFKALLFLASGVVMHAMAGELDMRKMSGLKRVLPMTRMLMLIGCLALAGFPLTSGFFSKDEIVIAALDRYAIIGVVLLVTALMTAYYTFRLYFRVFEGPEVVPAAPNHQTHGHDAHGPDAQAEHNHEPALMIAPLVILALGALLAGYLNFPRELLANFLGGSPSLQMPARVIFQGEGEGHWRPERAFWGYQEATGHEAAPAWHTYAMAASALIALLGILLAYLMHLQDRPRAERVARRYPRLTRVLEARFWVDEVYQGGIVEPLRRLGQAFFWIDEWIVDGAVMVAAYAPPGVSLVLKRLFQRGYLQGYALTMLFGVLVILILVFM